MLTLTAFFGSRLVYQESSELTRRALLKTVEPVLEHLRYHTGNREPGTILLEDGSKLTVYHSRGPSEMRVVN